MSLEFKVTFDGTVPGLSEHRLSLSAFGKALAVLPSALQRTASALVSAGPVHATGKIADEAKELDLEFRAVEDNCVSAVMACVDRSAQISMRGMLAEQALARLSADIRGEVDGTAQNPAVRRYLHALPSGLSRQQYRVYRDGNLVSDVSCGVVPRIEETDARLVKLLGQVVGVGFPPGATYVTFKTGDEKSFRLKCTQTLLEKALALRGQEVHVAALLEDERSRLLWLRPVDTDHRPTLDQSVEYLRKNWTRTLDLLAQ